MNKLTHEHVLNMIRQSEEACKLENISKAKKRVLELLFEHAKRRSIIEPKRSE